MTPRVSGRATSRLSLAVISLAMIWGLPIRAEDLTGPVALRFLKAEKVAAHGPGFSEPSGLDIAPSGDGLVSVSDDTGALFLLSETGEIRERIDLGDRTDGLEGIAWDLARDRFLAVREDSAEIIEIGWDRPANLARHPLSKMKGYDAIAQAFETGGGNDGLEGLALVPEVDTVVVIKENHPRLMLELTSDLREIRGALPLSADLGFVCPETSDHDLDVSGIDYDPHRGAFWISSDTGRCAFLFDPRRGKAIAFDLFRETHGKRHSLHNVEGIAISDDGTRLFVVSDDGKDSLLASFQIDGNI